MVVVIQRIGTDVEIVAVIFGRLSMSVLIDNFGLLGNEVIILSGSRISALVYFAIVLYFIYASSKTEPKEAQWFIPIDRY